jgi:hypothetical protein
MEIKPRIGPVTAGLAGVAVTAAAVTLMDKGNRKKVGRVLNNIAQKSKLMTDKAVRKLDGLDQKVETVQKAYRTQKKKVTAATK